MSAPVEPRYTETMYGPFPVGGDPRAFDPDPECSEPHEREAHRLACEAAKRGENIALDGPRCSTGGGSYAFGLGTYTFTVSAEDHAAMNAPLDGDEEMDPDAPF